jgi:hypothetical protein
MYADLHPRKGFSLGSGNFHFTYTASPAPAGHILCGLPCTRLKGAEHTLIGRPLIDVVWTIQLDLI